MSLNESTSPLSFCKKALQVLEVSYELPESQLNLLRAIDGPVIIVANHGLGAIDALVMMILMGELRPDFKFVGNSILTTLPELNSVLIPVHIMGKEAQTWSNFSAMRHMLAYLGGGGMMGLFPAGEVAITYEGQWTKHLGRIVKKSRATVIPLFFESKNSSIFRYVGRVAPGLRMALLLREMRQFRQPVCFKLGTAIPFLDSDALCSADELTLRLRHHTLQKLASEF